MELADEDVGLVDFVGHDHELLVGGELEDGADVGLGQGGAGGVARVDDDDGAHVDAVALGLAVGVLDGGQRRAPVCGLVEVIGHAGRVEDGEGGGVERVLGDGHEDAGVWGGADDVQKGIDAGRGTGREVDACRIGGKAIPFCCEVYVG